MREKLIQYVNLVFAGTNGTEDIRQEILQNTLDRYDDLIAQGKTPEAAYSLAISGIGDISEILSGSQPTAADPVTLADPSQRFQPEYRDTPVWKKILRAVAVCMYILCAIPVIVLSDLNMEMLGLCGTLSIAAVATALIIIAGSDKAKEPEKKEEVLTPHQELLRAVKKIINTIGLIVYFIVSFTTGAWHITWVIFPLEAAIWGLVKAILDLKEADKNEI